MNILIKSACIIDSNAKFHKQTVDILIENDTIVKIDKNISTKDAEVISFENLHVSPGWFDSSVTFGEPGYEERETLLNGLKTAALSGFTHIALQPNTTPKADNASTINYLKNYPHRFATQIAPVGTLTVKSEGIDLAELYDMKQHGAISFGDYKKPIANPNLLKLALQYTQSFEGLVQSFPLDAQVTGNAFVNESLNTTQLGFKGIPSLAEELQISRDLYLLEYTGGKLHIPTISTVAAVRLIKEAKSKGLNVSCSVAVHQLIFTDKDLESFNTNYKVMPPLRGEEDRIALIEGVKDGTIDIITSDHSPMDIENKKVVMHQADFGTIGLESIFSILRTLFDTELIIEKLNNGKPLFGIPTTTIKEGDKADLTLFNPEGEAAFSSANIVSTSKNSAFIGTPTTGNVYGTIANGTKTLKSK